MKIRTAIISSGIGLIVVLIAIAAFMRPEEASHAVPPAVYEASEAVVQTETFEFEVVASQQARAQGLSGRKEVPAGYGMLFVFDVADRYGFWMKDMLVPIDIIWLRSDGTILAVERNVSPDTYPKPFYPPQPVRLVLETRPGEMEAQGWGIGTKLNLPL